MKTSLRQFSPVSGWKKVRSDEGMQDAAAQLVLAFGSRFILEDPERVLELKKIFPSAIILSCSTSGEILESEVADETIACAAVEFEKTKVIAHKVSIRDYENSFEAGKALGSLFSVEDLAYVFLLSDGGLVNGSELVKGIHAVLPSGIPVTGGLAGDGPRFEKTLVGLNEAPASGFIAAIGFYGKSLRVGHGSKGGWDIFGHSRTVTRSDANVLYELDGKNALDLYKTYLGEYAAQLPSSALLFPLSVKLENSQEPIVRTILSIDEENKSMRFAGDIPEGSVATFMKANFDKLVEGSHTAANSSQVSLGEMKAELVIMISCVGRKLVLGPRIEEEVEVAREIFGESVPAIGFYSYGEISPFHPASRCELHNQTMTITALSEV